VDCGIITISSSLELEPSMTTSGHQTMPQLNDRCGDASTTFSLDAVCRGSSSSQMTLDSDFDFVDIMVPSQNGF